MEKRKSVFTSFWFSLVLGILAILMLADYATAVWNGDRSPRKIVVLIAWVYLTFFFVRTFLARLRERRESQQ
jgi:ABC-type transport system involved in cytochrome bd biosynthesis fused ATPase/permease subunit